jgi:hypothetical protein
MRIVLPLLLLAACTQEPASIKVKLPKDSVSSKTAAPQVPVYRRKGERIVLRASAFNSSEVYMGAATVNWKSSDASVAEVGADGTMTITGSGEAQVTATSTGYSKELTASLPVKARIVGEVKIIAPPKFTKIRIGQEVKLKADVRDDKGNPITDARVFWKNDDHGVWAHDDGMISGASLGESTVVLDAEGKTAALTFEVVE